MPLNMYLSARVDLNLFQESKLLATAMTPVLIAAGLPDGLSKSIFDCKRRMLMSFDVGYWRDAFDVDRFFVEQLHENGDDRASHFCVSRAGLGDLAQRCGAALEHPSHYPDFLLIAGNGASGALSTADCEPLRHTVKVIEAALRLPCWWSFTYRSHRNEVVAAAARTAVAKL